MRSLGYKVTKFVISTAKAVLGGGVVMDQNCIFCKIIAGTIPTTIIEQNDDIVVIKDIAPKAPVHYLIIPKKHVKDVASMQAGDLPMMGQITAMAQKLASGLSGNGSFRLVTNNGEDAGQSVFHLHFHFLSGKRMLDL